MYLFIGSQVRQHKDRDNNKIYLLNSLKNFDFEKDLFHGTYQVTTEYNIGNIKLQIKKGTIQGLTDTGVDISTISQDVFLNITIGQKTIFRLPAINITLRGTTGYTAKTVKKNKLFGCIC